MRGQRQRAGILKSTTPDNASRSSGYSSSSSQDSLATSPDGRKSRVSSAGYQSRPSSGGSVTSPVPRPRQAWGPQLISIDTNPLAYTCYQGSKHLHPERLPSARRERPTSLRLWENTTSSQICLRGLSRELQRLDLRKMKLGTVEGDLVKTMELLQTLDLTNNNLDDKSFDKECRNLTRLVELRLDDNNLSVFPSALCIKTLRRVSLARNQIVSLRLVDTLKRLQILVLEENQIKTIQTDFFRNLLKLQVLYLGRNLISEIPPIIRVARNLRVLDLSRNDLKRFPGEILQLPSLDDLNLSGNKIFRMPKWSNNAASTTQRVIEHIDLSDNALARFPAFLLFMTEKLDLSGNQIKFVQGEAFVSLQDDDSKRLDMCGNPSVVPPASVCQSGFKSMVRYFQNQKVNGKTYYGLKVYSIGAYMSGKSSLIQSMLDQQSRLENDGERTDLLDIVHFTMNYFRPVQNSKESAGEEEEEPESVELSWWDFSGNTFYQSTQLFFLQHPGLIILNVNLATYTKDNFYSDIGVWLEWLFSKSEQITLIVVGTKSDRVQATHFDKQKWDIMKHIHEYLDLKFSKIEAEIQAIEGKAYISAALSEQLKSYRNLIQVKTNLIMHPEVVATSAKSLQGIEELQYLIKRLIKNEETFPKVMSVVPSLWTDVENYIANLGITMSFPVLTWPKFSDLIVNKFGMWRAVPKVATYLQNIGKIFFLPRDLTFSNYVVLRPAFLIELLRTLYKDSPEEEGSPKGTPTKLGIMKHEFLESGVADRNVLRAMWSFVEEDEMNKVTSYLMAKFEIAYPIGELDKDRGSYTLTVIADEEPGEPVHGSERHKSSTTLSLTDSDASVTKIVAGEFECKKVTRILLPWFVRTKEPSEFVDEYQRTEESSSIKLVFRFPAYVPIGLFERLIVRVHGANNWRFLYHWQDGIMAEHLSEDLHLFLLRQLDEGNECLIKLEVKFAGSDNQTLECIPVMWQALMPVVRDFELFLESFPGAFYQRYVICPLCRRFGFIGEWLAPKELQCISGKACMHCNKLVPTAFLITPKETRQLDLEQIRRERRLRRAQNARPTDRTGPNSQALQDELDDHYQHDKTSEHAIAPSDYVELVSEDVREML